MGSGMDINSFDDMVKKDIALGISPQEGFCAQWLESALRSSPEINQTFHSIRKEDTQFRKIAGEKDLEKLEKVAFIYLQKELELISLIRCYLPKMHPIRFIFLILSLHS